MRKRQLPKYGGMLGRRHCNIHDPWKCLVHEEAAGFVQLPRADQNSVDWDEPQRVAEAIHLMKVKHAVIISVDRDEIKDGGS